MILICNVQEEEEYMRSFQLLLGPMSEKVCRRSLTSLLSTSGFEGKNMDGYTIT